MKIKRITAILTAIFMLLISMTVSADNISQIIGDGNTVVFIDVPSNHWAKNDIEYFAEKGIVNGVGNGRFEPESGVTREEFCKMLVLTFNAALETPNTPSFSDVDPNRWSYPYVEVCREFLTGYANPFGGQPAFHPTEAAKREDIAVALVRMLGFTGDDSYDPYYAQRNFWDSDAVSPGLLPYISVACEKGLIKGYEDGSFGPLQGITRAETVALLNRATKQAMTDINAELELSASVIYSSDKRTATVNIVAEEGTTVTVDGETVKMSNNYYDGYEGNYVYTFEEEGSKDFVIIGKRGGKTKTVNVTAKYEIGAPTLTITSCPTTSDKTSITISGKVSDEIDDADDINVTVNGSSVYPGYNGSWSKTVSLTEGNNTITVVATNSLGKSTTETKTVNFGVGAPTLTITSCPATSDKTTVTISGKVSDINDDSDDINVTVNGSSVYPSYNGSWSKTISLTEGSNTITVIATNSLGKSTTETRTVNFGVGAPTLTITSCSTTTDKNSITISGKVSDVNDDADDINVTVNGSSVYPSYNGSWSKTIYLSEGNNTITIVASNSLGKSTSETRTVNFGVGAPTLTITSCPTTTDKNSITISGKVSDVNDDADDINVTVNGSSVYPGYNGSWSKTVSLTEGNNTITIVATNSLGKSTSETREVEFGVGAPTLTITSCPTTTDKNSITISGKVSDVNDDADDINVTVNGSSVYPGYNGSWSKTVSLTEGNNTITIVATNSLGKSTSETKTITLSIGKPEISFINCPENTTNSSITIKGKITGTNKGAMLFVNDIEINVNYNGEFSKSYTLKEGSNKFVFRAVNDYGKETSITKTITYSPEVIEETETIE